jgi:hypothetical protein
MTNQAIDDKRRRIVDGTIAELREEAFWCPLPTQGGPARTSRSARVCHTASIASDGG